jgi:methylmalonyl-CoA mutase cobalamin-binding subunit
MTSDKLAKTPSAAQTMLDYRSKWSHLLDDWRQRGRPGREGLERTALQMLKWKDASGIQGIWAGRPPLMVTATLDDGFGHGLQLIHLYAAAIGMPTFFLGLMQTPANIVKACRTYQAEYLGLTVLHSDTQNMLREVVTGLDGRTRLIAGGPVFRSDPGFAARSGIDVVAGHVHDFIQFCLTCNPCYDRQST